MSTETIRAQLDERCRDASRADGTRRSMLARAGVAAGTLGCSAWLRHHAVRIQNAGTAHTVSVFHDPAGGAGDPAAEAVDIVSTNEQDTALGVRGRETGKGTVKITHGKPSLPPG